MFAYALVPSGEHLNLIESIKINLYRGLHHPSAACDPLISMGSVFFEMKRPGAVIGTDRGRISRRVARVKA